MKTDNNPHDNYSKIHNIEWLFKGNPSLTPAHAQKFMGETWKFLGF